VEQRIATTGLSDGSRIAYAVVGRGPLLVHAPGWLTHLELGWAMPPERALYESLAQGRTLVRYDKPGCGLSGPTARAPSMDLELRPSTPSSARSAARGSTYMGPRWGRRWRPVGRRSIPVASSG
jgi:pimeloyl-ACP methyl ester carboxylesterase